MEKSTISKKLNFIQDLNKYLSNKEYKEIVKEYEYKRHLLTDTISEDSIQNFKGECFREALRDQRMKYLWRKMLFHWK